MAPFIHYPDPRLCTLAPRQPVNTGLRATGERLLAAIAGAGAYGLAGAHIGEVAPVMVLNLTPEGRKRTDRVFFNPQILARADRLEPGAEGSVSMPGIEVTIKRPAWIELGFDDETGAPKILRFEGFVARCALHETEQNQGIFFLSHLSRLKRESVLKRYSKLNRER